MNKSLLKIFSLVTAFCWVPIVSAESIPKALPLNAVRTSKAKSKTIPKATKADEATAGILYRMDKNGNVKAIPINSKTAEEHNISSGKAGLNTLAKLDSKNLLGKGVSLKAIARKGGTDEFNDQDASAKTALYFSFGFGRPHWGGYRDYHHDYYSSYYREPYYYGGYYAPRVVYVDDCYYQPVCPPVYYRTYYYSYYRYGSCWY